MMGEAIEERTGEAFRTEYGGPFIEWQVAGDQSGTAFIALAEHFEEQLGTDSRERHVAQFVDDQQLDGVEMLLQGPEAALITGFHEFVHEGGGRGEGDAVSLLAGGQSQGQGDVGLAGAGGPKRNTVLALLDRFAARQLQNQCLVERGLRGEVEGVEALGLGKARQPDAALDTAPFAVDALEFAQTQQIAGVISAVLGSFHCDLVILAREGGKLQDLEMVAKQHLGSDSCQRLSVMGHRHADILSGDEIEPGLAMSPR